MLIAFFISLTLGIAKVADGHDLTWHQVFMPWYILIGLYLLWAIHNALTVRT